MTDKKILEEAYNRLLLIKELMRNHPMCAAKEEVLNAISFTEQEWQKADEEKESYDKQIAAIQRKDFPKNPKALFKG